ncbi:MAG: hypothetical protein HOP07_06120 [Bacteriovoracaceae bacterium]|nr:hypothetical protein [Bacteriovoracaceae bacterium]
MVITKLFALGLISLITTNIFAGNIIIPQSHNRSIKVIKPAPSMNQAKAVADGPTADPTIMAQIKKDWDATMNGAFIPNLDDSMPWAGGTLTRIAPGKIEYVNKRNGTFSQILDSNTNIAELAKKSGDINSAWIAQYGVDLGGGMASSPNNQAQQDGNKIAVNHTYTHGVSSTYTKEEPFDLGFGIGAFNDHGNTKFALKGQTLDLNQLMATNEYKALTGSNMVYPEPISDSKKVEIPLTPTTNLATSMTNQNDFNMSLLEQKKAQLAQALAAVEKIKTQIAQLVAIGQATPVANNQGTIAGFKSISELTNAYKAHHVVNRSGDVDLSNKNNWALDKMKTDTDNFFANTAPGASINWAGGTLTNNGDGSATYYNSTTGKSAYLVQKEYNFYDMAEVPEIGQTWKQAYGYNPRSDGFNVANNIGGDGKSVIGSAQGFIDGKIQEAGPYKSGYWDRQRVAWTNYLGGKSSTPPSNVD